MYELVGRIVVYGGLVALAVIGVMTLWTVAWMLWAGGPFSAGLGGSA